MTDPATAPSEFELEARGPHFPDSVTRLGFYVWFFLLLAFARLVWFIRDSPPTNPTDPGQLISYARNARDRAARLRNRCIRISRGESMPGPWGRG